jgi:ADP-ribose pyrophosphatase YjhB (NUDIX family)
MKKLVPSDAVLIPYKAKKVFEGIIFDTYQWPQPLFDGSETKFEMLKRPDTINAICIVDDKILILEEEQPHHGHRISTPLGRVDETDESTLEAAQREVLEETGYRFASWRLVKVVQFYTKIEWFIYVYVAWEVTHQQKPQLDAGEKITVKKESLKAIKDRLSHGGGLKGETQNIFKEAETVEALTALPEFVGYEIDR